MKHNRTAAAANAHAAAASAKQPATSARLAQIDAKHARRGDLAGFLREVGEAGITLADWLAAAGAEGIPNLALGREIVRLNSQMARWLDRWRSEGLPTVRSR